MNSDALAQSLIWAMYILFFGLVFYWFYRIGILVNGFLKTGLELTSGEFVAGRSAPPFYRAMEVKGIYKGREVQLGVLFSGFKNEFLPLPLIKMKLKETIGYNTNRLPGYAEIEKNYLVYKVKVSILWGIFDKSYPVVFSKKYFVVALENLFNTAEDLERGRTLKVIFK